MKFIKILGTILIVLFLTYSYSYAGFFDKIELGSDVRQYDPSRFPYSTDSIYYNGNQYWLMIAFAGTSVEEPVYPVYLDSPIYSGSTTGPFPLYYQPNYITNTNFFSWVFYDFNGFEPPGDDWVGDYIFFIDEDDDGVYDEEEAYREWTISEGSIRKLDVPIVNISGSIYPTISWLPVPYADVYRVNFYYLTEEGFVDFDVRLHNSGNISGTSFTYTGSIFESGEEYAVWVQAREIKTPYRGLFHNRSGYFTTHQAVEAEDVLDSFDDWTGSGDLVGSGSGISSDRRLNAFGNMLETAQALIDEGDIDGACEQLMAAYRKCDGKPIPKDFVGGDAVMDMSKLILHLMASIECPDYETSLKIWGVNEKVPINGDWSQCHGPGANYLPEGPTTTDTMEVFSFDGSNGLWNVFEYTTTDKSCDGDGTEIVYMPFTITVDGEKTVAWSDGDEIITPGPGGLPGEPTVSTLTIYSDAEGNFGHIFYIDERTEPWKMYSTEKDHPDCAYDYYPSCLEIEETFIKQ